MGGGAVGATVVNGGGVVGAEVIDSTIFATFELNRASSSSLFMVVMVMVVVVVVVVVDVTVGKSSVLLTATGTIVVRGGMVAGDVDGNVEGSNVCCTCGQEVVLDVDVTTTTGVVVTTRVVVGSVVIAAACALSL